MNPKNFSIEPCILVSFKLKVERGVTYHRTDLSNTVNDDGSEDALWETKRHFRNRAEAKEAERIYAKARQRVRSVTLETPIGFICPLSKERELQAAVDESQRLVDDFNKTATTCKIHVVYVPSRINADNVGGVSMLKSKLEETTMEIRKALTTFDAKGAREVLYATKRMVDVLADPESREELRTAREEAGQLCKEITRLVKDCDGHIKDALASAQGDALMDRVNAAWNF